MKKLWLAVMGICLFVPGEMFANSINGGSLTPCTAAPLSTYIDGSNSGCAVGVLVSTLWALDENGSGGTTGGATALNSGQILVTPLVSANGLGGTFAFSATAGNSFMVGSGQTATYYINYSYFIDPGPFMGDADLTLDPGNVTIKQFFCNDMDLINAGPSPLCKTVGLPNPTAPPQTLMVTTTSPHDARAFNPPAFHFGSIETSIFLDGTQGPATFDSIISNLDVQESPEPGGVLLALGGVAGLAMMRRFATRYRQ